jgi:hypothetical protein
MRRDGRDDRQPTVLEFPAKPSTAFFIQIQMFIMYVLLDTYGGQQLLLLTIEPWTVKRLFPMIIETK